MKIPVLFYLLAPAIVGLILLPPTLTALASPAGEQHGLSTYKCENCSIVFISIDTLRADHLGVYGYGRDTSPNIDEFAGENIVFMDNVAPMSQTLPSHTSMFTGLYPRKHGVIKNGMVLDDSLVMLAEILKETGYSTYAVIPAKVLVPKTNFLQGFDVYDHRNGWGRANHTYSKARELVEEIEGRFFLFLHFFDPHQEYLPPEGFYPWGKDRLSRYDGEVYYTDHYVGKVFELLRDHGLYEDSIIILASDHGESLGDHGYWGHEKPLYENCVHVPLIIKLPGSGAGGKRLNYQTSLIDIHPTLLDILGVERQGLDVDGLNLFQDEILEREFVFLERNHFGIDGPDCSFPDSQVMECGEKQGVRSSEYKYILRTRYPDEFYRHTQDSMELENLLVAGESPGQAARHLDALEEWLSEDVQGSGIKVNLTDEARERLRSLGYVA